MRKYTALFVFFFSVLALRAQTFVNGQAARAVFGQYTFTFGGATPGMVTNLPNQQILGGASGIAWANGILYVADSNRLAAVPQDNRVVMFNTAQNLPLPATDLTGRTSTYNCNLCAFPAFNALGQPSFTASTTGTANTPDAFPIGLNNDPGQPNMRQPVAVASDGNIVAVADTDNNRVLIWTSIPNSLNQPANIVLGQADFTHATIANPPTASSVLGPQGVWIGGGKLYVADTQNNRVLIWNSIPTANNQPADLVLGQPNLNTGVQAACDPTKNSNISSATVLCSPTSVTADASHVFVSDLGFNRVLIWNKVIAANAQAADVAIGQPDMTSTTYNNPVLCNSVQAPCADTVNFPRYALSDGTRLFVADGGNDRVLIFNTIPTQNGASADAVLGQPNFTTNAVSSQAISIASTAIDNTSAVDVTPSPTSLAFDGTNLYVADPTNNRVLVFTPGDTPLPQNSILNWASEIIRQEGVIRIVGTIAANDTVAVKVASTTYTYTVKSTDTVDLIAQGLVSLINAGNGDPNVVASFAGTGTSALYLSSRGTDLGFDAIAFSVTASNTANLTATASGNGYLTAGTAATGAAHMLVEINGTNLSDAPTNTPVKAPLNGGSIPTSLGGAQVFMDGVATPVYSASATQIISQIPYNLAFRNSTSVYVRTTHADGKVTVTNASPIYIAAANPGIFDAPSVPGQARPWPATGAYHQPGNPQSVIDVTGTVNAGDILTLTVAGRSYAYTVLSTDSLASIVTGLCNAINSANDPLVTAHPGAAFNRVIVEARQGGAAGNGIATTATASSSAKITLTAYTNSTCCNVVSNSPITATNPAAPGETITLSATGLGVVDNLAGITIPIVPAGLPYSADFPDSAHASVSATMGSTTAQVVSAGLARGSYGVYQVQAIVPQGQANNGATQVYIAQNAFISNTVTLPVGPANPNPVIPPPAPVSPITTWVDQPASGSTVSGTVQVTGWAIANYATISSVGIAFDGQALGAASYGVSRPDVCQSYPASVSCGNGNVNVGYSASVDTTQFADGNHTLQVTLTDSVGDRLVKTYSVTTSNFSGVTASKAYIDSPTPGATFRGRATFSGWAINTSSAVTGVSALVDGVAVGNATYGLARPDVCSVYTGVAGCPNVGWSYILDTNTLGNGVHTFGVRATSANGQNLIETHSFTVANWTTSDPTTVFFDRPNAQSGPLSGVQTIYGWALNPNSQIGSVAVSVDGIPYGSATVASRPDVCAVYQNSPGCPNVGWTFSLDTTLVADGGHTLGITVTPAGGQAYTATTQFQVANLAVGASPSRMYIDVPQVGAAPVSGYAAFAGWALNDNFAISSVSVSVDGSAVGSAVYGASRPDVCAVYSNRPGCPNVGWNFAFDTTTLTDGLHTLEVTSTAANGDRATVSRSFSVSNTGRTSPTTASITTPSFTSSPYQGLASFSGTAISTSSAVSRISVTVDGYPYGLASYVPGGTNVSINWSYMLDTTALTDGNHTFGVTAVASDGTYSVSSATFVVANFSIWNPTRIYIDTLSGSTSSFTGTVPIRGWAYNDDSTITGVTVAIDDVPFGAASYGLDRSDVCDAYPGRPGCPNLGWSIPVDTTYLVNGSHTLTVTATTATGQSSSISSSFSVAN